MDRRVSDVVAFLSDRVAVYLLMLYRGDKSVFDSVFRASILLPWLLQLYMVDRQAQTEPQREVDPQSDAEARDEARPRRTSSAVRQFFKIWVYWLGICVSSIFDLAQFARFAGEASHADSTLLALSHVLKLSPFTLNALVASALAYDPDNFDPGNFDGFDTLLFAFLHFLAFYVAVSFFSACFTFLWSKLLEFVILCIHHKLVEMVKENPEALLWFCIYPLCLGLIYERTAYPARVEITDPITDKEVSEYVHASRTVNAFEKAHGHPAINPRVAGFIADYLRGRKP